jgi:hypothetical protein
MSLASGSSSPRRVLGPKDEDVAVLQNAQLLPENKHNIPGDLNFMCVAFARYIVVCHLCVCGMTAQPRVDCVELLEVLKTFFVFSSYSYCLYIFV